MGRRARDDIDLACERWAEIRRQLLGLSEPLTARQMVGPMRCTLGNVQRHHDGAGSFTTREQHFPEVFQGEALLVNLAYKRLSPDLAAILELHYCAKGVPCDRKAEALAMSTQKYWTIVKAARAFVAGYLASVQDRAVDGYGGPVGGSRPASLVSD